MPGHVCKNAQQPSDMSGVGANGFPSGFDFHPFGLYTGELLHAGEISVTDVLRIFPKDACGVAGFTGNLGFGKPYCGRLLTHYPISCPHSMAVHTLTAFLVGKAAMPSIRTVPMDLWHILGISHGFGHGLHPRFNLSTAHQMCDDEDLTQNGANLHDCHSGVEHSRVNSLLPGSKIYGASMENASSLWWNWMNQLHDPFLAEYRYYVIFEFEKLERSWGAFCNFSYLHAAGFAANTPSGVWSLSSPRI